MIDHASKHLDPALTPQILLKSANLIKEIVWVSQTNNKAQLGDMTHTSPRFICVVQNKCNCFGIVLCKSAATVEHIR